MKKNLLMSLLVITSFSTMFARYDANTGTGLLGAGAPVNPGVGPVITGASNAGFIPAAVEEKYYKALEANAQATCDNLQKPAYKDLMRYKTEKRTNDYVGALNGFIHYYEFDKPKANCYAQCYMRSVN